ncbi:MAG: S8 family serine peptidase [Acidobacteriota bacterium]|nr:S8 family serine peptidase [Acidobacteriota bacterium]
MAKDKSKKKSNASPTTGASNHPPTQQQTTETTGRYLVLMREGSAKTNIEALKNVAGVKVASSSDFKKGAVNMETLGGAQAMLFELLNVAVVDAPPEQTEALSFAVNADNPILAMEPERVVHAIGDATTEYLRGYRDGVNHLTDQILGITKEEVSAAASINQSKLTWGLQLTNASGSQFTGKGIKVAVLDTGLDLGHPDFAGRKITSQSFIANETGQDGNGHGTHCIGTACGSLKPKKLPRYGVAYEAEIFAGKVLSNRGSGADGGILAGIDWAITNGCVVISMSLGAEVLPGEGYSQIYENVAKRALSAGSLIVAAAGNESERPARIAPVGHPANCPSILAVAAIDKKLRIASFSCGGINPDGGGVDIAGPGVDVRSSVPRNKLYRELSGTSMATPHVAGIAALFAQSDPALRGFALWAALIAHAKRLNLPSRDVGMGLVQAP